jgi:hypothetical protein
VRQRPLGLGQPERHLHGAVEVDGRCHFHEGLLPLAELRIQGPKAMVAVGLEGAHAKGFGEGEGLAVVGGGLVDVWGNAMRGDLAEEVQGIGLVAPFLVLASKRERARGEGVRLLQAAG